MKNRRIYHPVRYWHGQPSVLAGSPWWLGMAFGGLGCAMTWVPGLSVFSVLGSVLFVLALAGSFAVRAERRRLAELEEDRWRVEPIRASAWVDPGRPE